MSRISIKSLIYGTLLFLLIYLLSSLIKNTFKINLMSGGIYWLYLSTWIIPGYIAARISKKMGMLHGALVGLIVGLLFGFVTYYFANPPPNVQSISGIRLGGLVGIPAIICCSLGGLIWDIHNAIQKNKL